MGIIIIYNTVDPLVKGPFDMDFGNKGRILSVQKFWPAMGICEISGLEY
jgi:hypothetical protein